MPIAVLDPRQNSDVEAQLSALDASSILQRASPFAGFPRPQSKKVYKEPPKMKVKTPAVRKAKKRTKPPSSSGCTLILFCSALFIIIHNYTVL